jgi:hypothetical protein
LGLAIIWLAMPETRPPLPVTRIKGGAI